MVKNFIKKINFLLDRLAQFLASFHSEKETPLEAWLRGFAGSQKPSFQIKYQKDEYLVRVEFIRLARREKLPGFEENEDNI